jgi:hypothetical protein
MRDFASNPFVMNILQAPPSYMLLITKVLRPEYPRQGGGGAGAANGNLTKQL